MALVLLSESRYFVAQVPVHDARRQLQRLADFVDGFAGCFGREAQRQACRHYVTGLLSASERKSIQAMASGRSDAEYQRIHHFIANAPWDELEIWKRLRQRIPDREGVVVVDDTGFHKQGDKSVGVARQYCPPLGKVANCQVAVTSILRTARSTWPLAMRLYLPQEWLDDSRRRTAALIPDSLTPKTKWELALSQIARAKREGFSIQGVTADAGYGDIGEFRDGVARLGVKYVVRIIGRQVIFLRKPDVVRSRGPRRFQLKRGSAKPTTPRKLAEALPDSAFKTIIWGRGSKGPLRIRVAAIRVLLGRDWQHGAPVRRSLWLLVRRKRDGSHKVYFSNLGPDATPFEMVKIAYSRWAVEQSYQQLKDDLGFDHFEGRSWLGWSHHAALSAMAFTFLALERRRSRSRQLPTIPGLRRAMSRLVLAMTVVEDPELGDLVVSLRRDPPGF